MDLYIFRLDEGDPGEFRGVIIIFAADVPAVWRMLASDQKAKPVPGMVTTSEAAQLTEELNRLAPNARITDGSSPLGQVFGDAALTQGHRVTFSERSRITVMGQRLGEGSARGWVEHWYRRISDGGERG